jgi:hypothetical protein
MGLTTTVAAVLNSWSFGASKYWRLGNVPLLSLSTDVAQSFKWLHHLLTENYAWWSKLHDRQRRTELCSFERSAA